MPMVWLDPDEWDQGLGYINRSRILSLLNSIDYRKATVTVFVLLHPGVMICEQRKLSRGSGGLSVLITVKKIKGVSKCPLVG